MTGGFAASNPVASPGESLRWLFFVGTILLATACATPPVPPVSDTLAERQEASRTAATLCHLGRKEESGRLHRLSLIDDSLNAGTR